MRERRVKKKVEERRTKYVTINIVPSVPQIIPSRETGPAMESKLEMSWGRLFGRYQVYLAHIYNNLN